MAELMGLIEKMDAALASQAALFGDAGRRSDGRRWDTRHDYLVQLMGAVRNGRREPWLLQHAMTTSDFPLLFGDVLDRTVLGGYGELRPTWPMYVRRAVVPDFRSVKRRFFDGQEGRLALVPEAAEAPYAELAEGEFTYSVGKYERKMALSWEAFVNEDLDVFESFPRRAARAARRTEEHFATALFVASTGPISPFFSAGNNNLLTGASSALSVDSLATAYETFGDLRDAEGEPVALSGAVLVVPPALEVTARNILSATEIRNVVGSDTILYQNWLAGALRLAVNPYLSVLNTSTSSKTAWYLFADPNDRPLGPDRGGEDSPNEIRPALEMGFLRGFERPMVFTKTSDMALVGGGTAPPEFGSFTNSTIEYKVRHVLGGARMDPKAAVAAMGVA